MRRPGLALALTALLTLGAQARPATTEVAVVANSIDATVTLVDVRAKTIIGTIDINPAKTKVDRPGTPNYAQDTDVSPDGRTLYVSRGYLRDVAAFDIPTGKPLWTRPLNSPRADHMTLSADGHTLFVSAIADAKAYRIAAATGAITGEVATGVYPHDNKITRDGKTLINSSLGVLGGLPLAPGQPGAPAPAIPVQLTIADAKTLQVTDRIPLAVAFRPWDFSPNETVLYAQLSNAHAVAAYDLKTKTITRRLELPQKPGVTAADWDFDAPHHGLALTPDGKTLCLAGRASDYAALVRAPALTLIATVTLPDAPGWAEIADRGRACLVPSTRADTLSIIDIRTAKETARLPMGKGPKHITIAEMPADVVAAVKGRGGAR